MRETMHEPPDSALDPTMPLVNLHSHLEGSIRPATYLELCRTMGLPAPDSLEAAQALLSVDGSETCLHDYLERITPVGPILKGAAALERTSYEAAEDARRDGVAYFELRAGPLLHLTTAMDTAGTIEAMLSGLQEAERALGIAARLIVCALRGHDPLENEALARVAVRYAGRGVVGFDLAGDEKGYPARHHARAYAIAAAGGLGLTCHAGEGEGSASIVEAVQVLGARRIGHGTHLDDTPGRVAWAKAEGLVLEICPTSNVDTRAVPSFADHPVRRLFDAGVQISIGDDDPTTSRTRIARELRLLARTFGFTVPELLQIQRTGLEAAFAEPAATAPIRAQLDAFAARIGA